MLGANVQLLQNCGDMVIFRCYDLSADGTAGIHAWYNGLAPGYQAEIDATLEILALENSLSGVAEVWTAFERALKASQPSKRE